MWMSKQGQKAIIDPSVVGSVTHYAGAAGRSASSFPGAASMGGRAGTGLPKGRTGTGNLAGRDLRLDLFRGISLLLIFIDHIPDNFLAYFTLQSVSFSDAAEVFYFISGYVAALVYGKVLDQQGFFAASLRVYKRVWTLFIAHIVLFMVFVAEVSISVSHSGHWIYNTQLRVDDFLAEPGTAMFKALTLQFQPVYLDILPLYIVFLMVFPLVLRGLRRNALLVMIPSVLLYAGVQMWNWNLPSYPEGHTWYFDPFAWQLLFLLGAFCGYGKLHGRRILPQSRWLLGLAACFLLGAGAVQFSSVLHNVWQSIPSILSFSVVADKTTLAPLRVVNFLALAVVMASVIPEKARFLTSTAGWSVIRCGQHSLHVFCFSIVLAVIAQIVQQEIDGGIALQVLTNTVGIASLLGFGMLMAWLSHEGKLPQPPRAAG
jgi:hypothetical protein